MKTQAPRRRISKAVDHADGRLGARSDFIAATAASGVQLFLTEAAIVLALLVDVATGGKSADTRPGDHDATDRVVGIEFFDRVA